jgi:NADH-quinone oxidoreductase E subunit
MSLLENKEKLAQLDEIISQFKGQRGAVMRSLQNAQELFGYVPKEVQIHIADGLGVSLSEVYGVATFYSQFALEPRGRFLVGVCLGTACYVRGAKAIMDKMISLLKVTIGKTTEDGRFTLKDTRCLGACGLAPVIMINDDVYGRLVPEDLTAIVDKYKAM